MLIRIKRKKDKTVILYLLLMLGCFFQGVIMDENVHAQEMTGQLQQAVYGEEQPQDDSVTVLQNALYDTEEETVPDQKDSSNQMNSVFTGDKEQGYVEGEVLVVYKNHETSSGKTFYEVVTSKTETTKQLMNRLSKQENVQYVQPNYIYHITSEDTYFSYQYALDNVGQQNGTAGIDIARGEISNQPEKEVVVAVMDTGIDYTHEDLERRMWKNPLKKNLLGIYGVDTVNGDEDPMDDFNHGTHVAGIIAAESNNDMGISGVAGSARVKLMAVKVLDSSGYGTTSSIIDGYCYIYEAVKLGVNVRVINNSFGSKMDDNLTKLMINLLGKKGVLTVAAAGNDGENLDIEEEYPAMIESPYIISVASSDQRGRLSTFSNYGSQSVDLAAPGSDILSTVPYAFATFEPSLYTDEQKGLVPETNDDQVYCHVYTGFSELADSRWRVMAVQGAKGTTSAQRSFEQYFGNEDTYSLKWTVKNARKMDYYMLSFPYISEGNETELYTSIKFILKNKSNHPSNETKLVAYHVFLRNDGVIDYGRKIQKMGAVGVCNDENDWTTLTTQVETDAKKGDRCAIIYQLEVAEDTNFTIYADDFAISKQKLSKEALLPYRFFSGTSMSTPYVTGAVALLASGNSEMNALQLKRELLSCVVKTSELENKVKTGGTLSFVNEGLMPFIDEVKLTSKGAMKIKGGEFTKKSLTLKINGKEVPCQVKNSTTILVEKAEKYNGNRIRIELTNAKNRTTVRKQYVGRVNRPKKVQQLESDYYLGASQLVGTKDNLYLFTADGILSKLGNNGMEIGISIQDENSFKNNPEYHLANYLLKPFSAAVYLNHKIYCVVNASNTYAGDLFMASYDLEKRVWRKERALPYEYRTAEITNYTVVAYKGKIYLLGGVSSKTGLVKNVLIYEPDDKSWQDGQNLPVAMANPAACVINGSLYLLGGILENEPQLYSLKNGVYRVEEEYIPFLIYSDNIACRCIDGTVKKYRNYSVSLAAKKNKLLIAGNTMDGYGDLVYYNTDRKKLQRCEYSIVGSSLCNGIIQAVGVGDKVYISVSEYYEDVSEYLYTQTILSERIYQM